MVNRRHVNGGITVIIIAIADCVWLHGCRGCVQGGIHCGIRHLRWSLSNASVLHKFLLIVEEGKEATREHTVG